jgi:hypothetical protein
MQSQSVQPDIGAPRGMTPVAVAGKARRIDDHDIKTAAACTKVFQKLKAVLGKEDVLVWIETVQGEVVLCHSNRLGCCITSCD